MWFVSGGFEVAAWIVLAAAVIGAIYFFSHSPVDETGAIYGDYQDFGWYCVVVGPLQFLWFQLLSGVAGYISNKTEE